MTAEIIIQEASALPLTEQYRIGLRLLERAQFLFTEPSAQNATSTIEERRAAIRAAQEQFKDANLTTERLLEYKREDVQLEEAKMQRFYAEDERLAQ